MADAMVPQGAPAPRQQPGEVGLLTTLGRVKPMEAIMAQAEDQERQLKRSMGTLSLTFFGVAAIVGAGIFVLTGVAAATKADPALPSRT